MKRFVCILMAALLLSACSAEETPVSGGQSTLASTAATTESAATTTETTATTATAATTTPTAATATTLPPTRPTTTVKPTTRTRITVATTCACISYRSETVAEQHTTADGWVYISYSYDWRSKVHPNENVTVKWAKIIGYTGSAEALTVPQELDGYAVTEVQLDMPANTVKSLTVTCKARLYLKNLPQLTDIYPKEGALPLIYLLSADAACTPTLHLSKGADLSRVYAGQDTDSAKQVAKLSATATLEGVLDLAALDPTLRGYIAFE